MPEMRYRPAVRVTDPTLTPVSALRSCTDAPSTGLPVSSTTVPVREPVVMPWALIDFVGGSSSAHTAATSANDRIFIMKGLGVGNERQPAKSGSAKQQNCRSPASGTEHRLPCFEANERSHRLGCERPGRSGKLGAPAGLVNAQFACSCVGDGSRYRGVIAPCDRRAIVRVSPTSGHRTTAPGAMPFG